MLNVSVVVPNYNGKDSIGKCLDSLLNQTAQPHIIVVENGSSDGSLEYLKENYKDIELVINDRNLGFAGGVNSGIKKSIEREDKFVALFNNDAIADKYWLEKLINCLDKNHKTGIATSKILGADGKTIDSTGDMYTVWGLPYPRGREEITSNMYDESLEVFAGSGGASIYRVSMLKEIGLFDKDFFAYYEDVDISFRAQLAGWKVTYVPSAIVYHQIGATSSRIKGFTTEQTMKNLPWLAIKNVPGKYLFKVFVRLELAQILFWFRALTRHQGIAATKGVMVSRLKLPKKMWQRHKIQSVKKVPDEYIWDIITHDLPPNAQALRKLRNICWRAIGKSDVNND